MRISPDNAKIIIEEINGLRNNLEKIFQEMSNKLDAIEKKIKLDLPTNTHNPIQYRSPVKPINERKNSF